MSVGTEWQDYGDASSLASGDTFLFRDVSATPPSAGTVKEITAGDAAAAFASLAGSAGAAQIIQRMTAN
jgi:hypothetical protein